MQVKFKAIPEGEGRSKGKGREECSTQIRTPVQRPSDRKNQDRPTPKILRPEPVSSTPHRASLRT